jgi:hypothetical protein
MKYLYLIISFFICINSFAQDIDTVRIKKQAILITHVEYDDFEIEKSLDDIFSKYEVTILDDDVSCYNGLFLLIKEAGKESCEHILAYDNGTFYRLKGFKTSDFNIFFTYMLPSSQAKTSKKGRRELYIEKFDLEANYNLYYKKSKFRAYDPTSCIQIITIYGRPLKRGKMYDRKGNTRYKRIKYNNE